MRLLILCLLIYVGYRVLKTMMLPGQSSRKVDTEGDRSAIDDVMVKDPFCGTYFPARRGIKEVINGEAVYFCSKPCRDEYVAQRRKDRT